MNTTLRVFACLSFLSSLSLGTSAFGDDQPDAIALPVPVADAVPVEVHASPVEAHVACHQPKVVYRHAPSLHCHRRHTVKTVETVLIVQDKCSACCYSIPVCIPECCLDEACMAEHRGLFGRRVITYSWKCGFELEVVLRHRGDVLVRYYGV